MSMIVRLPDDLSARLQAEAARRGLPAESIAIQVLEQHVPSAEPAELLRTLFARWEAEDAAAPEDETNDDAIFKAIDDDRSSYRKLFPDVLKGKTW